ncbi:hypothetical protein B566_EDAN011641 [Ephemera danica]|nr:hypothetical protein B566_EDAN011641 [Ephemera danica]
MELDEDTISGRILRLNQQLMSPYCQGGTAVNSKLHVEGLQDALLALYEECGCDRLKKIPEVASFLEKFGTTVSELRKLRVRPTDFNVEAVIGRGNFGEVKLVRERGTGHYYAMKTLSKQVSQGQREASSYEEERDILALAARPGAPEWLTALQYAFQDASNLYLVMDLPEECVRFYVAEIVQAMNSLHKLGYVHRDVKPDNVLLDRCGHIKLADFGSAAKLNADGKVNRPLPVGTPEYIAPEVLQSVSDEKAVECDYWSLGVLAYELVFGTTPFQGSERTRIYSNIMSHEGGEKLEFPSTSGVSRDLKALISGLLEPAVTRFTYLQDSQSQNLLEFRSKYSSFTGKQLPFVGFTLTPGVPTTKILQQKEPQEEVQIIREIPNKPSDHPDIIRNRELKALREMLKDREERQDRQEVEKRAVETMKSMKSRWQTEAEARQAEIRLELQKTQAKLAQEKTRGNELDTRVRTREEQLTAERENSDRLQTLLQKRKENMSKARRETLTFMGDAQQITELRMKLGVEQSDKRSLQEKADLLSTQVVELQAEVRKLGQQLEQSGEAMDKAETLTIAAQERLKRVESRLQKEVEAHNDTKARLAVSSKVKLFTVHFRLYAMIWTCLILM